MVRSKLKSATSSKKWTPFKTKNKFGREGRQRVKIRWRVPSKELYRRIANYIKTARHPLISAAEKDVLKEAGWSDVSRIKNLIHRYLPQITVDRVMRVNNPYIAAMYELKKEEYRSRYKTKHCASIDTLRELELFHSTRQESVNDIVADNLDWRRVCRSKFGKGNCFSSDADYANCHANRYNGENRAFIVCQVLVHKKTLGSPCLELPPEGYDTTTGGRTNEIVYVKYNDNECLPQFVAYYKCNKEKDVFGSKYNNLPRNWF